MKTAIETIAWVTMLMIPAGILIAATWKAAGLPPVTLPDGVILYIAMSPLTAAGLLALSEEME